MKKFLALLCAALILTTAACAAPQDPGQNTTAPVQTDPPVTDPPVTNPPITEPPVTRPPAHEKFNMLDCRALRGVWSTRITLDGNLLYLTSLEGSATFNLYYSFDKYGHFSAFVDEEEFETALATYEAMVIDHMVHTQYLTFKGRYEYSELTAEEVDALWADGPEATARTDSETFVATLNLYHRCMKLVHEGQYYLEDGKLYTQMGEDAFECFTFSVEASALTLKTTNNLSVYRPLQISFPLKFTRYK